METNRIQVKNCDAGRDMTMAEAEKFAKYMDLEHKKALQLRLLVEESFGMISAITDQFRAEFWIEGQTDGTCKIHLAFWTDMDTKKKKELIMASRNKKNAAYSGLTGKIREMIEDSLFLYAETDAAMGGQWFATMGAAEMAMAPGAPVTMYTYDWSLEQYRQGMDVALNGADSSEQVKEAWDELEKSIIANVADDVVVAVKGNHAELTVIKKF